MQKLIYLQESASTNDDVLQFTDKNKDEPVAVFTLNQTQGRGSYGKTWHGEAGKNLAFSVAWRYAGPLSGFLINYYTACLVRDFLADFSVAEIKWPNDIVINQKKVCGILLERKKTASEEYYIAGIGINVLQENFGGIAKAGSVKTQTGKTIGPMGLAERLYKMLCQRLISPPAAALILDNFNENLFRKGKVSVFKIRDKNQNGIIKYADEDGRLWIDLEDEGLTPFRHKEVELLY